MFFSAMNAGLPSCTSHSFTVLSTDDVASSPGTSVLCGGVRPDALRGSLRAHLYETDDTSSLLACSEKSSLLSMRTS